jgi:hypothetical protein
VPSALILARGPQALGVFGACESRDQPVKKEERHLRKRA